MRLKRAKRVRLHLIEPGLPSVEGLLVAKRPREYVIDLPQLVAAPDADPVVPESRRLVVPRERVAFYEVVTR